MSYVPWKVGPKLATHISVVTGRVMKWLRRGFWSPCWFTSGSTPSSLHDLREVINLSVLCQRRGVGPRPGCGDKRVNTGQALGPGLA